MANQIASGKFAQGETIFAPFAHDESAEIAVIIPPAKGKPY